MGIPPPVALWTVGVFAALLTIVGPTLSVWFNNDPVSLVDLLGP